MVRLVRLIRIIKAFRSSKRLSDLSILGSSLLTKSCIGIIPKDEAATKSNSYSKNKVYPVFNPLPKKSFTCDSGQKARDQFNMEESLRKIKRFVRPGAESSVDL